MWSPRAQCDRNKFIWAWREILENIPNLHIWQDTVREILVENGEVAGLTTLLDVTFRAKCIVLTAGTFLNGLMHVGRTKLAGGRMAEPASYELTESIARHGIEYGRMKTGTPVRIDGRSVHYEYMETQDGECDFINSHSWIPVYATKTTSMLDLLHERGSTPCITWKGCRILPFSTDRFRVSVHVTAPASKLK